MAAAAGAAMGGSVHRSAACPSRARKRFISRLCAPRRLSARLVRGIKVGGCNVVVFGGARGAMTVGPSGAPVGALVGGKYRIGRLLAKGGMGVVYEAHHAVVRRRFAIEFLRRDLAERREILTASSARRRPRARWRTKTSRRRSTSDLRRRHALHRHGVPVGESVGAAAPTRGPPTAAARLRSGGSGLPRRRSRPRRRHRPPRSQAAQPVPVPS